MTLIVGFLGTDGALMASDSEASESGHSRFDTEKIWQDYEMLFGYSGNTSIRQKIEQAVKDTLIPDLLQQKTVTRWVIRDKLTALMKPILVDAYSGFVGDQQRLNQQLNGTLLIIGHDKEGSWILEVDGNNTPTFYNARGFQAIGSGSASAYVARALMEKYQLDGKTVAVLKVVAYRMLDTVIKSLGGQFGVGGDIHIWSSTKGGKFEKTVQEEIESIKNSVDQWTTIEREAFEDLYNEKKADEKKVNLPQALKQPKKR